MERVLGCKVLEMLGRMGLEGTGGGVLRSLREGLMGLGEFEVGLGADGWGYEVRELWIG